MSRSAPSDDEFETDEDYATLEWDEEALAEMDRSISEPSSPTKNWRSPVAAVYSPSTPLNVHHTGLNFNTPDLSPTTPSRPSRNRLELPGLASTTIARTLGDVTIEDDELPPPQRLFGLGPKQDSDPQDQDFEDDEVEEMLRIRVASTMGPPPVPAPRPLQASSTQSSFASTSSSNSLFSNRSRTSSMSSMESVNPTSPLKRWADTQMPSPSPSKTRKLSPAPNLGTPMTSPTKTQSQPDVAFSLSTLFGGHHGSKLETHIIVHSKEIVDRFDNIGVHLGVQWELARGVSIGKWTWDAVTAKMDADRIIFKGPNSMVAPVVRKIMLGGSTSEFPDLALWNEVDREYEAMREGKSRGLGLGVGLLDGEEPRWEFWDGPSTYYGGQIEYPLRLTKFADSYKIHLEKPRKGRSHRLARDLGSASVLHLSIPPKLVRDEGESLRRFLTQRFIINGRVYVPIPPKDTTSVYLIQTNQNHMRKPLDWFGDHLRISFDEFLQRHNPPELNSHQPFAKYTARFALGLSTSTPALEFKKKNIFYIRDLLAEGWNPATKPPAEKVMTDGCGWINHAGLLSITKRIGYDRLPTAVQGRIGGAKGLWVLDPDDNSEEPKIWIRDSQLKIKLEGDHRVHRIFDLLRASRPSQADARQSLSEQSVLCLSSNGIPDSVLLSLLLNGLEETVQPLLNWAPGAIISLWRAINAAGNVSGSRLQRIAGSKSRVLGFRDREPDEPDEGEVPVLDDDVRPSNGSNRNIGGGPLSLHEQAMELIQAGFHPANCAYLNDKLRYIIKTQITSAVDEYRISLPESTASEALVIPDPTGLLKPNEIYYRSSSPLKNPTTQTLFQTLTGPVILGRYPMRLPCDMQMVTAVNIPQLENWPDVIIASIHGQQSLLSLLSGGDYDGDTVVFIWLEEFLANFKNKPFTPPPTGFMDNFEQEVKTVEELGIELGRESTEAGQRAFQEHLLMGLCDSQVGLYSYFHDNAIWKHGYNHPNSILMAYIGNTILDAGKTGLSLKRDVYEAHERVFGHPRPRSTNNWTGPRRDSLDPFILQTLSTEGRYKGDQLLRKHDLASGKLPETYREFEPDADLLRPYQEVETKTKASAEWSKHYKLELQAIERHVDEAWLTYRQIFALSNDKVKRAVTVLLAQQKFAQPISQIELMTTNQIDLVKASYAYKTKEEFGFEVAFSTLCEIKARATRDGMAPNCRIFDELKTISGAASRATLDEEGDL